MAISEKRASFIKGKIDSGKVLSMSEVLDYEKYILQINNFEKPTVFSTKFTGASLYIDTQTKRFFATPMRTDEYDFRIYNISEIESITIDENADVPADTYSASAMGSVFGGTVGKAIAESIVEAQQEPDNKNRLITFFGLIIKFKDGSNRNINFISRTCPVRTGTRKYKKVLSIIESACTLLNQ